MGAIKGDTRRLDYRSHAILSALGLARDHERWTRGP